MKKFAAMLLVLAMVLSFAGCAMSHDKYMEAAMDSKVTVKTYVQATQSWWDNKITVYCQSKDGAYFVYEMACSEADAAKLVPGTAITVTGTKGEWSGEIEIMDPTFEFGKENDTYIAEALDVTALLGKDELIDHQNEKVLFKGMTVEKVEYKNGEPGDDIYVTVSYEGVSYSFCVERYLTGPETDVYKAFVDGDVKVGDVVNVYGFVYWYDADEDGESGDGINTHIIQIT